MKRYRSKLTVAKTATVRNAEVVRLFAENREEHVKIMESLGLLTVNIARVEERLAADKAKWGFLATILTSTGVVFLADFIRKLWTQ
jgi:hypothetical protein